MILSRGGNVDTKTIWIFFLLILPCWRVFFLGRPALHCAGTDRPQMVGVCSLHVDCAWLLASSSRPGLLSSVQKQRSICSSRGHGFKPRWSPDFFFLGFFTQMHKLRSLRRSFLHLQCSIPPTALKVSHMWNQDPTQHTVYSTYSWILKIRINFFFTFILYCGSSATSREDAGRRKKNKELGEP